ncbi:hypothetical protein MNBD_GAMMA02-1267 [hydrothermal vent metagenome]|uniref:HTH araC/xylS-type domain-containing protein n=1 Tax=hydrothermal vent metagenome TaxID=652676 RepID=A0A3B0W501_9ZZZZ
MIKSQQFQPHQRLLGFVVWVFVTVNFRSLVYSFGWQEIQYIRYLPIGLELLLPPLMYIYVCSITRIKNSERFGSINFKAHLLLPLVWLTYDLSFYIVAQFEPNIAQQDQLANSWFYASVNDIEDKLILLSTWIYLVVGALRVKSFSSTSSTMAAQQRAVLQRWFKQILIWMFVLGLFLLVNHIADQLNLWQDSRRLRWQAFNLYLAFTSYYLGFLGYRLQSPRLYEAINSLKSHELKHQATNSDQLELKLQQLMLQQAIYLDPEVSIKQVAAELDVSAESLSFMLNQKLKISFRDLINQHRIEAVKNKIEQQSMTNATILDVALEAGFNSQASFYRAFKKFVGMTPLQYSQQHQNKQS